MVSIVILTKNGGEIFCELMKAIREQDYEGTVEIIVVDSGSSDGTIDVAKKNGARVFNIQRGEFSFGPTRDFAFSKSFGEYIVTLSQDVVPADSSWLMNLVSPIAKGEADVVQGTNESPLNDEIFYWEKRGGFYFTREGKRFAREHGGISLSCTNMAIRRTVWEKVHFGEVSMNEDKEIQKKLFALGYRMVESREARAFHGHSYSWSSLVKRCENEGFGWRQVGVKYSFLDMLKDLIPKKWPHGEFVRGVRTREIRTIPELLFLFLRPILVFKGNFFQRVFKY